MSSSTPHADSTVLGVLYFPDDDVSPTTTGPRAKLRRVERFKRNPRTPEYMRELARATVGPECDFVEVPAGHYPARVLSDDRFAVANEIVLLWPDAIGHGWWPVERRVLRAKHATARVSVLTGRRRRFSVTPGSLLAFRVRRVIERLWLGEIVFSAGILLIGPFLVIWDAIRGHR